MADIVEHYTRDASILCFIGMNVSRQFKYRPFELPRNFRALFIEGQFDGKRVDGLECPTVEDRTGNCRWGCLMVQVYDMSELGYPTPWTPWPQCAQEKISFLRALERPSGNPILMLTIYQLYLWHRSLNVYPIGTCQYLVFEAIVIE